MKPMECEREAEILEAIRCGRWPDLVDPELLTHARECALCSDAALVAPLIFGEQSAAEASLPSAGLVWWKAELLARQSDAERATKPIAIAEKAGAAAGLIALISFILINWRILTVAFIQAWSAWRKDFSSNPAFANLWQPPHFVLLLVAAGVCFALVVVTVLLARIET